jgi:hypothetical protein
MLVDLPNPERAALRVRKWLATWAAKQGITS